MGGSTLLLLFKVLGAGQIVEQVAVGHTFRPWPRNTTFQPVQRTTTFRPAPRVTTFRPKP